VKKPLTAKKALKRIHREKQLTLVNENPVWFPLMLELLKRDKIKITEVSEFRDEEKPYWMITVEERTK
jgi:hypothetical protein